LIQLNEFVKVYPSRDSSSRYEFTIEEKTGLEIVLASDNSGDRSAWMTAFNMFIKMERIILNLEAFDADQPLADNNQDNTQALRAEISKIQDSLKSSNESSLLVKISQQLEKQNALLEMLLSPKSKDTKVSDKSTQFLITGINDKLIKLASTVDYISDRLSNCMRRDQDILKAQNQVFSQLDTNSQILKELKNAFYRHDVSDSKIYYQSLDHQKTNSSETVNGENF
jgi:hypothetical protein